jgi:metal-responsive CopG/Arc/MetJ family transcriptional regulator
MTEVVRKVILLKSDLAKEIEEYRFRWRYNSEAEAIRDLIRAGLASQFPPQTEKEETDAVRE